MNRDINAKRQFPGDHGIIRTDFPGGWANDTVNAFTGKRTVGGTERGHKRLPRNC